MRGITKLYSGVAALTDVSLEVLPGEVHALLGENGAGKSTLMNVATGVVQPNAGTIEVNGQQVDALTPSMAAGLGIAIVHQHPAVLPDLTVEENLRVALPASYFKSKDGGGDEVAQALLAKVGLRVHLNDRVETLSVSQKHLLEVAKALALRPAILVLDEPTAPLGQDSVELLFRLVRSAVQEGTAVVYITHRLAEVRELADRVTVLRDGRPRGTVEVAGITDGELLAMIVGRQLDSTFPPKHPVAENVDNFSLSSLSGPGFTDVSMSSAPGQIIGIAGVVGNGQSELLRALAGLESFTGTVSVNGKNLTGTDLLHSAAFMPADRPHEGLMMTLSVRENAAVAALKKFQRFGLLNRSTEVSQVSDTLNSLAIKAPSLTAPVSALSGGNAQKVVMARALLSEPLLIVADEPTQGVDVGARAELYRILREASASGIPVIVASSDAKELEGLCDKVLVMSRGNVVETLRDDEITEERIVHAAVQSTAHIAQDTTAAEEANSSAIGRFLRGDYAPSVLLVGVMVVLGAIVYAQNSFYLSPFNVSSMLLLITALGFIALGQTIPLLIGGIDLSVGPLAGFLVVVASFFVNDDQSSGTIILGIVLVFVLAAVVGFINGSLIRFGKFTAVAATLTTYIALQGLSLLLRTTPDGYINSGVVAAITTQLGALPVAFVALVVITVAMEFALRKTKWGWRLRSVGSDEDSARKVGVKVDRTVVLGYVGSSLFTALGAIMLMAQIGVGDPLQGVGYTLTSITAVVLGGTSLLGGRGTFVGTLLGSVLLIQVLNATTFLGLSQMWQYLFQGILILAAAILFSVTRARKRQQAHV
jgi:ribose transport system ATP-binding protein